MSNAASKWPLWTAAVLIAGATGCKPATPVGRLAIEPVTIRLEYPHSTPVRLEWQPSAELYRRKGEPTAFVHLLNQQRQLIRTFDHGMPGEWKPGQPQSYEIDVYQSALAEPLAPGTYMLGAGLYDPATGDRWPLTVEAEELPKREYKLATVVVPTTTGQAPAFQLSGGWLQTERRPGLQVLTRRCLLDEGTIRFERIPGPGTIRLALTVPRAKPSARSGDPAAALEVTGACRSDRSETLRPGFHWIGVSMEGPEEITSRPCEVRFRQTSGGDEEPYLCLDVLAWRPAGS